MLYDLRRADASIKWLVTCLLATFGLSYLFGAVMVSLYAGFTPQRVAATYAGPAMSMPMPPDSTMIVEHPMSMADFARPETHAVDTNLLIQDTHVHVPMYGVIAAALSLVVVGLSLERAWRSASLPCCLPHRGSTLPACGSPSSSRRSARS